MKELPLFGHGEEPFALTAEEAVDGERIQREKEERESAIRSSDKRQLKLKEKGSSNEEHH